MTHYSKNKIYLMFAGIGVFFFLFALLLFNQGMTIKRISSEIEKNWLPSIVAVNAINTATADYRTAEAQHIMAADSAQMNQYESTMQSLLDQITSLQSKYEPMISTDKERVLYQKFSKTYDSYLIASKQVVTLSQNDETEKATNQLKRNTALFNSLSDDLLKLVALNNAGSTEAARHGAEAFSRTKVISWIGTVLTVVLIFFCTQLLNKAHIKSQNPRVMSAVKLKIWLTLLLVNAFFLVFSGLFYQQMARVNDKIKESNVNWIPSVILASELNTKTSDYRIAETMHVLSTTADDIAKFDADILSISTDIATLRKKYRSFITSKEERSLYDDFSVSYAEYLAASQQALGFSRKNDNVNAAKLLSQSSILSQDFSSLLEEIVDLNKKGAIDASRSVDEGLQTLKIITIGGSVMMLLFLTIAAQLVQAWLLDEPLPNSQEKSETFLTIKTKLRLVFFGMVVLFMGFSSFSNHLMESINVQSKDIENNWLPSILAVNKINVLKSNYRITEMRHVTATSADETLQWDKEASRILRSIAKINNAYAKMLSSEEEREIYQRFTRKYTDYMSNSKKVLSLSRSNDKTGANTLLKNSRPLFDGITNDLNLLVNINTTGGSNAVQLSTRVFNQAQQTMLSVVLAIFMLAIFYMIVFDKNISEALQRLTLVVRDLAKGVMTDSGDGFKDRHDEIGQMGQAVTVVTQTLQALTSDSIELIEAAKGGVLSARVDTSRHPGEFGKIVSGMNSIIDALSKPLTEVAQIMQNLALGDLDGRMQGDYEGELRILKGNVNRSLDALVSLLTELSQTMQYMANTDLTHSLTGNYQGEFSVLKVNTNQTIVEMIGILQEITSSTSQAAAAVTQTSEASKYVAKEASLQMQAVENVSNTIAETAISVNEIAQKAKQGSELARNTASFANDGQVLLNKLIELIQHIDAEYGKIEQITAEITRIADKTHLLSLNAGLEAMRAGEHGLAFGFVAQQIGQLAEEVSTSARDIGGVITSSGQKVRLGVHATQETQAAMEQISQAAQSNENTVQDISVAIVQQSAAVKSLSERVGEIRVSSEATASAAEEISATMIHLAQSVRDTAAQAKRFKLVDPFAKQ